MLADTFMNILEKKKTRRKTKKKQGRSPTATTPSAHHALGDAQMGEESLRIGDMVDHLSAWRSASGFTIAGARERDESQTLAGASIDQSWALEGTSRRAVDEEEREAILGSGHDVLQLSSVGKVQKLRCHFARCCQIQ